ncbi:hypothetical protein AAFX24_28430 [Vibrio mediterranei]|uniref:hypothetical protein n=1 Tax=Vibrio mediterranei TaxID=689 RepID=UPI0038CDE378
MINTNELTLAPRRFFINDVVEVFEEKLQLSITMKMVTVSYKLELTGFVEFDLDSNAVDYDVVWGYETMKLYVIVPSSGYRLANGTDEVISYLKNSNKTTLPFELLAKIESLSNEYRKEIEERQKELV